MRGMSQQTIHRFLVRALSALLAGTVSCSDTAGGGRIEPEEQDVESTDTTPDVDDILVFDPDGDADVPEEVGSDTEDSETTQVDGDVDSCAGEVGCPCSADEECLSGYCIGGVGGLGRSCSEQCTDVCTLEGWECRVLVDSGADAVRLCVPALPWCEPCLTDADCGSPDALCEEILGESFCLTPCLGDEQLCPSGSVCDRREVGGNDFEVCVPESGLCVDCVDFDNDGYGVGADCEAADCDDTRTDIFPGAPELCDGRDNDCDDRVDETFALSGDVNNCGACGRVCEVVNGFGACLAGECVVATCEETHLDCDGEYVTGCEVDILDPLACTACSDGGAPPGSSCGTCGVGTLVCNESGTITCQGDPGATALNACGGCTVLGESPGASCGACGTGTIACDGLDSVECLGAEPENACGGCSELASTPGAPCGDCGVGFWTCTDDGESLFCDSDEANVCGGCESLDGTVGAPCGSCESGRLACGPDGNSFACVGDLGPEAVNNCGGCGSLSGEPGTSCGACLDGRLTCSGLDDVICEGALLSAFACLRSPLGGFVSTGGASSGSFRIQVRRAASILGRASGLSNNMSPFSGE